MTPEQQEVYRGLMERCIPAGLTIRSDMAHPMPGGWLVIVTITGLRGDPMQRLLFPDGYLL